MYLHMQQKVWKNIRQLLILGSLGWVREGELPTTNKFTIKEKDT